MLALGWRGRILEAFVFGLSVWIALAFASCWGIWMDKLLERSRQSGDLDNLTNFIHAIQFFERNVADFSEVIGDRGNQSTSCNRTVIWEPPPLGWIKVNIDTAISQEVSALALVARDYLGNLILAASSLSSSLEPALAKLKALERTTSFAKRRNIFVVCKKNWIVYVNNLKTGIKNIYAVCQRI